ncbi:MAG: hypothetical protein IKC56_01065 [Clostridia bacterium]|nr:hypothetical protein [Clostridia bacterium]
MSDFTNQMFYSEVYEAEDFQKMRALLIRCRIFLYAVTGVFALFNLIVFLHYRTLPYGAPRGGLITMHCLSAFLYMVFLVVYGIRFRRVKNYNKTLFYVRTGKEEETEGVFLYYMENDQLKDDVEFLGLMFLVPAEFRKEEIERRFFYDKAKPLPPFKEGDTVSFVSQGALIVRWKITHRLQEDELQAEEN